MGSIPAILDTIPIKHRQNNKKSKPSFLKRIKPVPTPPKLKRIKVLNNGPQSLRSIRKPLHSYVPSTKNWSLRSQNLTRPVKRRLNIVLRRRVKGTPLAKISYLKTSLSKNCLFFTFQKSQNVFLGSITNNCSSRSLFCLPWSIRYPLVHLSPPNLPLELLHLYSSTNQKSFEPSYATTNKFFTYPFVKFQNTYYEPSTISKTPLRGSSTLFIFNKVVTFTNDKNSFFYVNAAQNVLSRATSLKFNHAARSLYLSMKRYKRLRSDLSELNILRKRNHQTYVQLFLHAVPPRLINDITHQEQTPPFTEISARNLQRIPVRSSRFTWNNFLSRSNSVSLRRASFRLHPSVEYIFSIPQITRKLPNKVRENFTKKTGLTAPIVRQFMHKRLFRLTPVRTPLRRVRFVRKILGRLRRSNLCTVRREKEKKIAALRYEKALFEEILATPKGEKSPLLSSLLYTGFERMPSLDQRFGNKLFIERKKLRRNVLNKKLFKRKMRRYEIRNFLRRNAVWARRIENFRLLSRSLKNTDFLPHYEFLLSEEVLRRAKNTRRYWKKRTAFFARRSVTQNYFSSRFARWKRRYRTPVKRIVPRNIRLRSFYSEGTKPKSKPSKLRFRRIKLKLVKKRLTRRKAKRVKAFKRQIRFFFITPQLKNKVSTLKTRKFSYNKHLRKALWTLARRKSLRRVSRKARTTHRHPVFLNSYFAPLFSNNECLEAKKGESLTMSTPANYASWRTSSLGLPLPYLLKFWTNPFILKYLFLKSSLFAKDQLNSALSTPKLMNAKNFVITVQHQIKTYFLNETFRRTTSSNVWSLFSSTYLLRKKLLRSASQLVFKANVGTWSERCLTQFLENISGRKVAINVGPFIDNILTVDDHARCLLWDNRSSGFKKLLGHRIFTSEAVMLITAALRLKDPTLLSNWIRGMLARMSFWKYRVLFRYLKFLIRHLFRFKFAEFGFKGFKLRLKGKISVGGNSRSRVLFYRVGDTSHTKMSNKVAYDLSFINTFTGVLGFKLWFFY